MSYNTSTNPYAWPIRTPYVQEKTVSDNEKAQLPPLCVTTEDQESAYAGNEYTAIINNETWVPAEAYACRERQLSDVLTQLAERTAEVERLKENHPFGSLYAELQKVQAELAALKSQESPALVLLNRTVEILHMNATWSNSAAELADEIADFLSGKLIQESPADAWARGVRETFLALGYGNPQITPYAPPASLDKI